MLCYLDSDDAENSLHLFTVVTLFVNYTHV